MTPRVFALATPTDRYGPKRVLNGVLALWVFVGVAAYFIQIQTLFYGMAILAGLGLGSVQAASRTFLSLLVPGGQGSGQAARIFGFYALCGKASSVIGPMLFGYVTVWAGGNQRPAFLALTGLFLVGLVLLQRVADPRLAAD